MESPFHVDEPGRCDPLFALDLGATFPQQRGKPLMVDPVIEHRGDVVQPEPELAQRHDPVQPFEL